MKKILTVVAASMAVAFLPVSGAVAKAPRAGTARAASVSGLDEQYLTTSMEGDLFEIRGGKLAESKSRSPWVLRAARTIVRDHIRSYAESASLARRLGVEVPSDPTMTQTWQLKMVAQLRGATFNHWYSSLESLDHEQDIAETTGEVNNGSNAEVRKDAKNELPMLHRHLRLAQAALAHSK